MGLPVRYNIRNLFRRKLRTSLTVLGIALIVAIAVIMLAYSRGILYSLRNNGDPENVLVLSRKAEGRIFSSFAKGDFGILVGLMADHVARYQHPVSENRGQGSEDDEDFLDEMEKELGSAPIDLIAPYVNHTELIEVKGAKGGRYGKRKLGIIQGVDPDRVFHMNNQYRLIKGEEFTSSSERVAMVGSLVYARLGVEPQDVDVGKELHFNGTSWPIVGVFEASGTSADSEIWVPVDELTTVLNRADYSFAVIKLKRAADVEGVVQMINRSEQTELKAVSEAAFFHGFAETFRTFATIAVVVAIIITIGGIMAGMNTMYTAVTGRVREIGMLQVLGFAKRSIVISFVLESALIALAGGIIGCALGYLINGMPMKVTMGVFQFRVDFLVLALALGMAVVIGLVGAFVPALRAVRLRMVDAMRYM